MTIAPGTAPVTFELAADPPEVCAGGKVRVTVRMHDNDSSPIDFSPELLIDSIFPHPFLTVIGPFRIPAGGDLEVQTVVTIPHLPSGTYGIQVYGFFDATATVRVRPSGA